MKLGAKTVHDDDTPAIWQLQPASAEAVADTLAQNENDPDGRSEWLWVRLPNGDLILGVYPQGDTYLAHEMEREI